MMVSVGWKTNEIGKKIVNVMCTECHFPNILLVGQQRLFNISGIPILPFKKETFLNCENCGSWYSTTTLPANILTHKDLYFKTPWWSFIGLPFLIAFISFAIFLTLEDNKRVESFIQTPTQGSVFVFKLDSSFNMSHAPYTYARVEKIEEGRVILRVSEYSYWREKGARRNASKESYKNSDFSDIIYELSLEEFQKLKILSLVK